jgi:hypothetical protein
MYGGGMHNSYDSSPTLANCTFSGNSAEDGGGIYNNVSNPNLTNCTFSGNWAHEGSGMFNGGSSPTLTNCTFSGNSADEGGGIYNYQSSPLLSECNFSKNWAYGNGGGIYNFRDSSATLTTCTFGGNTAIYRGGAMCNRHDSSSTLTNCTFSGNSAGTWAGGIYSDSNSSPTLTNCVFSGNSAYHGGGMYNQDNTPTITNCTFSKNAGGEGGAINNDSSSLTLTNCMFWGNSAAHGGQVALLDGSSLSVTYCAIQGGQTEIYDDGTNTVNWGSGNINADPRFVHEPIDGGDGWGDDPATGGLDEGANDDFGDLRLQTGPPCIDAGDNTAVPADACDLDGDGDTAEPIPWDLDGDPRFLDDPHIADTGNGTAPIVDMGAYEYRPASPISFKKCQVRAGRTAGKDSITVSGTCGISEGDLLSADELQVTISAADMPEPCIMVFTVGDKDVRRGRYTSPRIRTQDRNAPKTSLRLDTNKGTFSLRAQNVDLTGLGCPLVMEIEVGQYWGLGEADEDIVNGPRKPVPIQFMMGVKDMLRVDRSRPRFGRKASSDSLSVSGAFTVEDAQAVQNCINSGGPISVILGGQSFAVEGRSGKFNLGRCTFSISLRGIAITGYGEVDFGIDFCGITLMSTERVDLGPKQFYSYWELTQYDQVGSSWDYETNIGFGSLENTVYSDGIDCYRMNEDEVDGQGDFYYCQRADGTHLTGLIIDAAGGTLEFDFDLLVWPESLRLGQGHSSQSPFTGYFRFYGYRLDWTGTVSSKIAKVGPMSRVKVPLGTYEAIRFEHILTFGGPLKYSGAEVGTMTFTMKDQNYAVPDFGIVKRIRTGNIRARITGEGSISDRIKQIAELVSVN